MLITLLAVYLFFCYPQIFWLIVLILWLIFEFMYDPFFAWAVVGTITFVVLIAYLVGRSKRKKSKDK